MPSVRPPCAAWWCLQPEVVKRILAEQAEKIRVAGLPPTSNLVKRQAMAAKVASAYVESYPHLEGAYSEFDQISENGKASSTGYGMVSGNGHTALKVPLNKGGMSKGGLSNGVVPSNGLHRPSACLPVEV